MPKNRALILVLLRAIRAITLQRCRIVVRDILGQYQYYCMFCLVTDIVGSNLKSKNQEVSGFNDQWVLNAMVDFNEILHKCLTTLLFERPKFSRNLKKSKFESYHIQKKCHYFCTGVYRHLYTQLIYWYCAVILYSHVNLLNKRLCILKNPESRANSKEVTKQLHYWPFMLIPLRKVPVIWI